jgi:long-chain acyl-CoA synthetase
MTWAEFLAKGDDVADERVLERMHALQPQGLATLIYTSGTTGPPKGVMLSHENIAWTAECAAKMTGITSSDRALSYLPLSHIAEQMFSIHGHITSGLSLYFAESLEKLPENLKEVRPTLVFGVPRIWEKFHAGLSTKLSEAKGAKAKLAKWARAVGRDVSDFKANGKDLPFVLSLKYAVANKLIFSKVKAAIGLDAGRMHVSGAAPVAKEVLEFMASLDIVINEVYGQSEDTGPTTFNTRGKVRFGTVGQTLPGVEVKIADDGEICVRGKNVFLGYYKEPEATAETLIDGWLHSGDLGAFDKDGFLTITGRKKEIIITAGGKNIAPKNIEAALKNHPLVGEAVVIGDRRKFLSALVTLEPEAAARFAAEHNIQDVANLHHSALVRTEIQKCLDEVNREFARVEQVKKFTVLPRAFSMDTGELTPTLKVKRKVVNDVWSKEIEAMYEGA